MDGRVADGTMATLIKKQSTFDRFGPSILAKTMRGQSRRIQIPSDRLEARKLLREKCPLVPGVYGWLDPQRQLIYVGKSKSLCKRLLSYFAKNPSDNKMDRIRQHSETIVWEPISHELLALLREQELIHRWRPEFNSMGQPTRMQPAFLCIAGSPEPNGRVTRQLNGNFHHAFGPISGTKRLRAAIVSLNQIFRLRDCPDKTKFEFQSQKLLFDDPANAKCIRHELGSCPAPCAGMCTSSEYLSLVANAVQFLEGKDKTTLQTIEKRMREAANREAYETAAIYRDCLLHLSWLDRRLTGLRLADQGLNGILNIEARRNRPGWMILRGGRIVSTTLKPKSTESAIQTMKSIAAVKHQLPDLPGTLLEMSLQLIIMAWFRKNPQLKKKLMPFDQAEAHCQQILNPCQNLPESA